MQAPISRSCICHSERTQTPLQFAMDRAEEASQSSEEHVAPVVSPSRLDFTSSAFDPLAALHTPHLQPPVPDAAPLDNVAKCRAILPPELPESLANVQPAAPRSKVWPVATAAVIIAARAVSMLRRSRAWRVLHPHSHCTPVLVLHEPWSAAIGPHSHLSIHVCLLAGGVGKGGCT